MTGGAFAAKRSRATSTYIALGDSFTAGNGCDPRSRWSDLVADDLRLASPTLKYVNLARDGADSEQILKQVPEAISHQPDLVTLVCGANDVILSLRPDIESFSARLELMLDRLKNGIAGVRILTATYPESTQIEGVGPRTEDRIRAGMVGLNQAIRSVSASRGVYCLDVIDHPGIRDPGNYETDRLHPSSAGHIHAAKEFRKALDRI